MVIVVYRRGTILNMTWNSKAVILGGPFELHWDTYKAQAFPIVRLYTILALDDIFIQNPGRGNIDLAPGETAVIHEDVVAKTASIRVFGEGEILTARRRIKQGVTDYTGVIYGECPECDDDEGIFYEGDYLCGWCRESLEREGRPL